MFESFKDTIFYKSDSEIEYKVKALELLQVEYPNDVQVRKELKECKVELKNEKEIEKVLEKSNIGMYVIRDLNVNYKDLKAQIDYIIITAGFIYLVDCQNLYGNIVVNEMGEFFKKKKVGEKVTTEQIESPLAIGDRNKAILKKIWSSKIHIKDKMIFEDAFEKSYKVIAVVNSRKTNVTFKNTPSNLKKRIIESDNLIKYIKSDLEMFYTRRDLIDNKDEMHGQAYRLMDFNVYSSNNWEQKYRKMFNLKPIVLVEEKETKIEDVAVSKAPKVKEDPKKKNDIKKGSKKEKVTSKDEIKKIKVKGKNKTEVIDKKVNKKNVEVKPKEKKDAPKKITTKTTNNINKKADVTTKKVNTKKEISSNKTVKKNDLISKNKPSNKLDEIKDLMTISSMNSNKDINVKLKKLLLNYRQKKYKENSVPDYYIFTDEELNTLISKKPKSVDELKRKKILTPVKIRMFGEDIIKIIKKVDI